MTRSRRKLQLGAGILGAAVLLALITRSGGRGAQGELETATVVAAAPAASRGANAPALPTREQVVAPAPGEQPESPAAAMAQTRDLYLEFATYPPWSRPATPTYAELYDFNQQGPSHGQVIGALPGGREVHARVSIDHMFVEPGRPATVTAECWTEKDGVRGSLPFEAVAELEIGIDTAEQGEDEIDDPVTRGQRTVGSLQLQAMAARPDVRTARLAIEDQPALASERGAAGLLVVFQSDDTELTPIRLGFRHSGKAPMRVLGMAREQIVDGSLAFTLDVEVTEVAPVRLRGALARAGKLDAPIAVYDQFFRPTRTGRQQVTITFFGRILREAEVDGPYELYRVHGIAYVRDAAWPEVFWQEDRTFTSRRYRAEQFSGAEWNDPEKDHKLRLYADAIDSLNRQ